MSKFTQPNAALRSRAFGKLDSVKDSYVHKLLHHAERYDNNAIKALFPLVKKPKRGDWLLEHKETGQRFDYWKGMIRNHPGKRNDTIYLLPIGDFPSYAFGTPDEARAQVSMEDPVIAPCLEVLRQFATAFFQMKVKLLPNIPTCELECEKRLHDDHEQLHAGTLLESIQAKAPKDAFCIAGITMMDLYPRDEWNFVFGLASLQNGSGVFSFARYDPAFFEMPREGTAEDVVDRVTRSAARVMVHEIGHMFGLRHCIYFDCLMLGSNHAEEASRRPTMECPVCLRKFHDAIGFDARQRYEALRDVCGTYSAFAEDHAWLDQAIKIIDSLPPPDGPAHKRGVAVAHTSFPGPSRVARAAAGASGRDISQPVGFASGGGVRR